MASPIQEFDPWGVVRQGGISQTSLNFTGQRLDATGLLYYHARYYDPKLGQFLSLDTLVPEPQDPQDLNRYSYVKNNPVRYTDPSGNCIGWVWGSSGCKPIWETGQGLQWNDALDNVQTSLDVAGMVPGVGEAADLANAGISAARGNYGDAALSVAAMVPLAGSGATATKLATKYGDEVAVAAGKAADALCSFTPDTPVATANGPVPIGDLAEGDLVLAYHEATRTTAGYTITAVLVHTDLVIVDVTIAGERITTTPEHPFFVLLRGWVPAGELQVGDRLRSVGLATNTSGTLASQQEFDPWGVVRQGGIGQTSLNYTGQRLDGTGLLYYHARYYDPKLGRFVSADSVVPEPKDSQDLNRYSYVKNNPQN